MICGTKAWKPPISPQHKERINKLHEKLVMKYLEGNSRRKKERKKKKILKTLL